MAPALRRGGHRPAGGVAARLPRVLVRLATPAPSPRRRRLPGGRARPARLQHLRQAAPGARLPAQGAGPERGRPDPGPGRRLGRGRRARLGRRAGLAAGHAPPQRVERLVVLNAPHPIRFRKGRPSPGQLRGSWYILAFQAPWLPERLLAARDFRGLRRALGRQPTRPGAFTTQDIDRYVAAAAQPGGPGCRHQLLPVRCARQPLARRRPWVGWSPDPDHLGDQDRYLGRELAEPDPAWVPAVRVERIPRPATGSRPTPPNRSTNAWWTSSSSLSAASWELLDVLAVAAVAYRKADPAPRSTSTTDRAPPSSAVQFRRGRTSRGSERMRTTSAVSIATSVPAPIAIPRSDCASADASFTPYRVRERSARACARGDRARRRPKTVANHAERIHARINASTRAAPGVFSMQHDLLPEEGFPRASSLKALSRPASPACS